MTCTDHYASGEPFTICRCTHCGFQFTQSAPVEAEIGRYYESPDYISHRDTHKGLMNRVYHWVRRFMLARKARLIKHNSGLSRGTLLDIGTGTGYFPHFMQERGWRVSAIEKSPQARQFAKTHFALDVNQPDRLSGKIVRRYYTVACHGTPGTPERHVGNPQPYSQGPWYSGHCRPQPYFFRREKIQGYVGGLRCAPPFVALHTLGHATVRSQT